ncbi:hypothetical protein WJX72_012093 [[Myrmecia] bisecta]|uniref:Amidase domain-containing protein n=1 Tax=[Myrmecia] bisecta TaxID=41462 RepID=A0AAW1PUE7_9CHLO
MRLLFITLEFSAGTFSGNGVYAQSQVRGLATLGHEVFVVSCKPEGHTGAAKPEGAGQLVEIAVPVWNCLDRSCSWQEFADGVAQPAVVASILEFAPQAVLGVDWSSVRPYKQLVSKGLAAPFVYMNYRVYLRTALNQDREFMLAMEGEAVAAAALTTALSRSDADCISEHLQPASAPQVLLPALRTDMEQLPLPADVAARLENSTDGAIPMPANGAMDHDRTQGRQERKYLTCCVRLSPEKEPERFVELIEHLAKAGWLHQLQVTPLLCGSATTAYAADLKARLRAAEPSSVIEERFLGPQELAQIYAQTKLNFHPCLYDAYGMTVVEAASRGAASVINKGGTVGAGDLLRADQRQVYEIDMHQPATAIAAQVVAILQQASLLAQTGAAAAVKARSLYYAAVLSPTVITGMKPSMVIVPLLLLFLTGALSQNPAGGVGGTVKNFTYTAAARRDFITSNYTQVATSVRYARTLCKTGAPKVPVVEATIDGVHQAMLQGNLTCTQLAQEYVQRISFYDKNTTINAIRVISPDLFNVTAIKDAELAAAIASGNPLPDLFCVPLLVKDNFDTVGVATANGAIALLDNLPPQDATMVAQLKAAGAVVLAKTNMAEWAFSNAVSIGSAFGIVRNPYDLDRVTAGSSGGTAASVSASFGMIGLGSDTGNSIRGPAGHNGLVGIRSTIGLTSRAGIIPLILNRDIGGPIGRTVTDVARVFQNIVGPDPRDPVTDRSTNSSINPYGIPANYTQFLKADGLEASRLGGQDDWRRAQTDNPLLLLQGKTIGVVRKISDVPTADREFLLLFNQAIVDLRNAGANIVENFTITGNSLGDKDWPGTGNWYVGYGANGSSVSTSNALCPNFREDLDTYLATAGAKLKTLNDIYYDGGYHPSTLGNMVSYLNAYNGSSTDLPTPQQKAMGVVCTCGSDLDNPCRLAFRTALIQSMDNAKVDAIIYPGWSNPPRLIGDYDSPLGDNSQYIPPSTGAPGMVVPMGYSSRGLPAALQMVARPFDEPTLFTIAYAYEQLTKHRTPPPSFPECQAPDSTPMGPLAIASSRRHMLEAGAAVPIDPSISAETFGW